MKSNTQLTKLLAILFTQAILLISIGAKSQTLFGTIEDYSGNGELKLSIYHSYISPNDVEIINIKINEHGQFSQSLKLNSSAFGYISYSNPRQRSIRIYLEPEKNLGLSFYEDSLASSIKFKGDLAEENRHSMSFNDFNATKMRMNIRTKVYSLAKDDALPYLDSIKSLNLNSLSQFMASDYYDQMRSEVDYIWAEELLLNLLANHDSDNPEDFGFINQIEFESSSIANSYRFSNYFFFWYIVAECIKNHGVGCSKEYLLKIQLIKDNLAIENKEYPLALVIRDYLKTPSHEALNQLEWYKETYKNSRFIKPLEEVLLAKLPFDSLKNIVNDPMLEEADKTVLVNFWASWCKPCIKAIPDYNQLVEEFGDKDFRLINFNWDDKKDEEKAKKLIEKHNFSGVHIFLDENKHETISSLFYIQSLPRKLLYVDGELLDLNYTNLKSLKDYIDN